MSGGDAEGNGEPQFVQYLLRASFSLPQTGHLLVIKLHLSCSS
jgi:hypothetical protein